MKGTSTLTRREDKKVFRVARLGHWSDIVADDGETDSVKLYGFNGPDNLYVSASKGFTYAVKQ